MGFMGAIAAATKAVRSALSCSKTSQKSFDDASFKAKIAEVTSSLADVKFALVDARTEAAEKDAEILRLPERVRLQNRKYRDVARFPFRKNKQRAVRKECHFVRVAKRSTRD